MAPQSAGRSRNLSETEQFFARALEDREIEAQKSDNMRSKRKALIVALGIGIALGGLILWLAI